jgi:hypothetical protein
MFGIDGYLGSNFSPWDIGIVKAFFRWSIEVFFKEAKKHLKLVKSQANDFDAQIADVTISMMQYIILTFHKRFQAYETLGELFRQNQQYFLELTLVERLWGLFLELQRQIIELFELDIEDVIEADTDVVSISGNTVTFRVECQYADQNFDDPYSGFVTALVIADLF